MKKLITILAIAITLVSCTNNQTMEEVVQPTKKYGTFTFTYNGVTKTFDGLNDPNNQATVNLNYPTLETSTSSAERMIKLDCGLANGGECIYLLATHQGGIKSVTLVKNATVITTKTGTTGVDVVLTEKTFEYVSGTFYAPNISGTFTKVPVR